MARARDQPELFDVLFHRHVREVHRFVARRVFDPALCDDITAVTFEKCWSALPNFRPQRTTVRPWLFRIAANEIAGHVRSESRRARRERRAAARDVRPLGAVDDVGDDPALHAALGRLSERHQVVLTLRFFADLSPTETAAALGVSRRHCAVIQHRALAALRSELEGDGDG